MDYRTCTKCGDELPATTEFFNRHKKNGLRPNCKPCQRAEGRAWSAANKDAINAKAAIYRAGKREELARKARAYHQDNRPLVLARMREAALIRDYGITADQYDSIFAMQGGRCAICKVKPKVKSLAVDHDHETGEVRGLLCIGCNTALGRFGDNVAGLLGVVDYLRNNRGIVTAAVGGGRWSSLEVL